MAREKTYTIFGRLTRQSDIFKLVGLLVFVIATAALVVYLWPTLRLAFEEGGVEMMTEQLRSQGAFGVFTLLLLQFLQIVVAFIPGEATQLLAGALYGPLWGTIIILIGCVLSSAFVYMLVHRLGAPFVQSMVSDKYLAKVREFERSGKLSVVVFILFLIPAMPKDVFTYLVPLTNMRMRNFLIITTVGRIPGVLITSFAANGLMEGHFVSSIVLLAVALVLLALGIIFRERIFAFFGENSQDPKSADVMDERISEYEKNTSA